MSDSRWLSDLAVLQGPSWVSGSAAEVHWGTRNEHDCMDGLQLEGDGPCLGRQERAIVCSQKYAVVSGVL